MSTDTTGEALCHEVDEALADVLDGTATARLYDHIAACDRCRDARHDAERAGAVAAAAGADFRAPDGFAERLVARLDAAPQGGAAPTIEAMPVIAVTRAEAPADGMATAPTELAVRRGDDEARTERAAAAIDAPRAIGASPTIGAGAPAVTGRAHDSAKGAREALAAPPPDGLSSNDTRKPAQGGVVRLLRRPVFVAGLAGAMAAAAAAGLYLRGGDATGSLVSGPASGSWTGKVTAIARASADKTGGLEICDEAGACAPASDGAEVPAGARLRTDARTRARIALGDGSEIALDRASEASFEAGDVRVVRLAAGSIVADVATADGRPPARLVFDQGELRTDGAKLALATTTQRASVEIARGAATLQSDTGKPVTLRAGEESTVSRGSEPTIASATSLADRMEWSDASRDEAEPVLRGLGELRAKRPGSTTEKDRAVRLSKHAVKIRIVDLVARTEVDETFTNDTDEELEGIFRFPLPPGAQIEGLSLEVDGQLMAGAFVDRDKGAAIWRGVIQNAAPKAPRPREEIFWVPGPWRDPALLEWQRGGRFELKIFPIPKRGSRRVVLSYTQAIEPSAGVRRFTYPLAHDEAGTTKVDSFDVDLQVLGHDKAFGVQTLGYEMGEVAGGDSAAERRSMHASGFVPSGDLSVEYALPDRDRGATAWAYRMDSTFASPAGATARRGDDRAAGEVADAIANDASPYVAIAIRPKLPRWQEAKERLHVLVVDTSRSMFGERYARATRLASSIVREMDRRDSFLVLACDAQCEPMLAPDALGAGRADEAGSRSSRRLATPMAPGAASAGEVERFLGGIEPDGASDLAAAIGAARAAAGGRSAKELRVIYLGDGTPTVGPTRASHLEAAVRTAMPAGDGSVIAVALGADSDTASLQAIARGGGGVVIPYAPGQKLASAALDVLGAAYGEVLRDPVVELPAGLTQATPSRLDSIRAGGEALVFARMSSGSEVDGVVRLTGRVGGERFEKSYPLRIVATSSAGNAFVPRLFAAAKIEELDRAGGDLAKRTSIELSKRFAVASRFTSLLVLESEAMFDAFGLTQSTAAPVFTGEQLALSESSEAEAAAEASPDADASGFASPPSAIGGGGSRSLDDAFEGAFGSGAPAKSRPSTASPAPAATMAPPPRPEAKRAGPADRAPARSPWEEDAPRRRMVPMRKVFDRKASFDATNTVALQNVSKLEAAERELRAAPDSRDKTVSMYALYATSGRLGEAQDLTSRWSGRDALDPEALIARADLAARQGDRPRAMRILGGLADVRPGDKAPLRRLVELHDAAGNGAAACAHRVALADLTPSDASLLADAMRCSQSMGQSDLAAAMRDDADPKVRSALEPLLVAASTTKATALGGDVRLAAEWTGADDLDFALVDAQGRRISWMGSPTKVAVTSRDATSLRTESVAFAGLLSGTYVLEVSRAADRPGAEVARGEVTLTLAGETRRVPFTLAGARTELGTVRVFFTSRLVPVNEPSGWWNRR